VPLWIFFWFCVVGGGRGPALSGGGVLWRAAPAPSPGGVESGDRGGPRSHLAMAFARAAPAPPGTPAHDHPIMSWMVIATSILTQSIIGDEMQMQRSPGRTRRGRSSGARLASCQCVQTEPMIFLLERGGGPRSHLAVAFWRAAPAPSPVRWSRGTGEVALPFGGRLMLHAHPPGPGSRHGQEGRAWPACRHMTANLAY
jgi:hypothetical protein